MIDTLLEERWPNAKDKEDEKEGVHYKLYQSLTIQSLVVIFEEQWHWHQ